MTADTKTDETTLTVEHFFDAGGLLSQVKPDYRAREGQPECAAMILEAIRTGQHFMGEAGTGFGKSFTVLIPAIIEAITHGKRFVISTETIALQEQYFFQDLPLLQRALNAVGHDFTFAIAKGRSNYICRAKYAEAFAKKSMTPIQQWAEKQRVGIDNGDEGSAPSFCSKQDWLDVAAEEDCERRACPYYGDGANPVGHTDCFVYEAIKKRAQAQIVVTNHTMFLLDLWLGNVETHPILGEYDCAIIDEAHTLPEKAQQTWGSEFGPTTISRTIKLIEKMITRAGVEGVFENGYLMGYQMMEEEIFKPFEPFLKEAVPFREIQAAAEASHSVAEEVAANLKELFKKLKDAKSTYGSGSIQYDALDSAQDRLTRLYTSLLRVYGENVGDAADTKWLSYMEPRYSAAKKAKYAVLHSKPITVAPLLNALLFQTIPTVVMLSATMRVNNDFRFMRNELGVPKDKYLTFVGASPFDYEKNVTAYFPTHLPDPTERDYEAKLANEIEHVIRYGEGKALVLFTSNKLMESIYWQLESKLPYRCFMQGQMPKMRILEEFKEDVHSCLFATRSFFTGIDVPGDALSTVILTRAPFRVPTEPLFAARCALIKDAGGSDFADYSLPLMILDVRQAFGRLIRTENDKGVFALLDSRAMRKSYGGNIRKSLPLMQRVENL